MTTEYSARVTRDGSDFQAELVVWDGGQIVDAYLVGWFDSHARALAAANEDVTDALTRQAEEAAELALEERAAGYDSRATLAEMRAPETLVEDGLRLAGEDEPGWSYRLPNGRSVWVTDEPRRAA